MRSRHERARPPARSPQLRADQFRIDGAALHRRRRPLPRGQISELFLNHKAGSSVGTLVRDLAIVFSFAVQHGADAQAIRRALCRDSAGRALGPLGEILDLRVAPKRLLRDHRLNCLSVREESTTTTAKESIDG